MKIALLYAWVYAARSRTVLSIAFLLRSFSPADPLDCEHAYTAQPDCRWRAASKPLSPVSVRPRDLLCWPGTSHCETNSSCLALIVEHATTSPRTVLAPP